MAGLWLRSAKRSVAIALPSEISLANVLTLQWVNPMALVLVQLIWSIIRRRATIPGEGMESEPEFSIKVAKILTSSMMSLPLCLGTELGLFDCLEKQKEVPLSSDALAEKLKLKERYVREWLDCMVTAKVVETDLKNSLYWLPKHRANSLATNGRPSFMKLMNMDVDVNMLHAFVAMFEAGFQNYEELKECFKEDGPSGLGYDSFEEMDKWLGIINSSYYSKFLIPKFVPSLPKPLRDKLDSGAEYLDVACGIGVPGRLMAKEFPNSTFCGIDFSSYCVTEAKKLADNDGLTNTEFRKEDAAKLPIEWNSKFDWVTAFISVHDQSYPEKVLEECYRVLKPGGYLSLVELYCHSNAKYNTVLPNAPMMYTVSLFYCMTTSLSQKDGTGLGTLWGMELAEVMLKEAGFRDIKFEKMPYSTNVHMSARKPE